MLRKCVLPLIAAAVAACLAPSPSARADTIRISTRVTNGASLFESSSGTFLELFTVSGLLDIPDEEGTFDLPIFDVEGNLNDRGRVNLTSTPDLEIVIADPDSGESGTFEIEDVVNGILEDFGSGPFGNLSNRTTNLGPTSFMIGPRTFSIIPSDFLFRSSLAFGESSGGRTPLSGRVTMRVTVQGVVPEPSALALAAVGGVGVAAGMLRRRRAGTRGPAPAG